MDEGMNYTSETKPGYKTTEFYLTLVANIGAILDLTNAWQFVPHRWAVIGLAIVNGLYSVGRGQAKQGIPYNG